MSILQHIELITEGETEIFVFKKKESKKGPGTKDNVPFYNPSMELNRDLSILINQWIIDNSKEHVNILDGLAASGIRGLRLANELQGDFDVTINDWNDNAHELIKKNIKKYKFKNAVGVKKNLNTLLSDQKFHYIDIDPFGSPVYFIDSAIRSIYNNGIIACTSTDTATLCGVYPKVCIRRYGVKPFHSHVMHETGLRILIGFLCREVTKYDKGIEPLLCYSTDHYFRVYIRVKKGVKYANESASNLRYVTSKELFSTKIDTANIGPLWLGKIENKKVINDIIYYMFKKRLNTRGELLKLLDLLENEANAPPFFYTTDNLATLLKLSPPPLNLIIEKLKEKGYNVTKTHFSKTGFKTNCSRKEIETIFKQKYRTRK
jgi:tRNA (guanine26-N2/guanine27-N2)-dimethyltransferase